MTMGHKVIEDFDEPGRGDLRFFEVAELAAMEEAVFPPLATHDTSQVADIRNPDAELADLLCIPVFAVGISEIEEPLLRLKSDELLGYPRMLGVFDKKLCYDGR